MPDTITTKLHFYKFDISDAQQANSYTVLCIKLKAMGLRKFATISPGHNDWLWKRIKPLDGCDVSLELKHVFNNQWNTGPTATSEGGLRVFDWSEPIFPNDKLKSGQWLEQTTEMASVRDNTHACGYCGYQTRAQRGDVFCPQCIDSEYLAETDLNLTRMQAVSDTSNRAALSHAERAHLLPLYTAAQLHGSTERGKARIKKARADIEAKHRKAVEHADDEYQGFIWLMDNGLDTSNCIYYSHTGIFCFGGRRPVSADIKSALLDKISEFPFSYTIKCEDGQELERHYAGA